MENDQKSRPGCVTVWLWVSLVLNALAALGSFGQMGRLGVYALIPALASVACIVGCILLMKWKKVGFYLLLGAAILGVVINCLAGMYFQGVIGLLSPIIWYAILNSNNSDGDSCWDLLE